MKDSSANLLPQEGSVVHIKAFFPHSVADDLLLSLTNKISWRNESIRMFGRLVPQPRLTAWHGDADAIYTYAGLRNVPRAWTEELAVVRDAVAEAATSSFNSVLLNLYRDGSDYMGWHRDNEPELGSNPVIASVSFGAERRFLLRQYSNHAIRTEVSLGHGDLLVMSGHTQTYWEHSLPKRRNVLSPRINLTFRKVLVEIGRELL